MTHSKMRVGLIDVDNRLPSLPLMKIKSYYSVRNIAAEFAYPLNYYEYDPLYASAIFDFSDKEFVPRRAIAGGTGYDPATRLPEEIETCQPDYSLYPQCDFSYQRFTYGCTRKCGFCVAWKMGTFEELAPMNLNPRGKSIYLLDNNFFASERWRENIKILIGYNQPVQFEGIDARIVSQDDEMLHYLNQVKLKNHGLHMAWDTPGIDMEPDFKKIIEKIKPYKITCYVLIGYFSTEEQDMHRVQTLDALGISPYVMPFNKSNYYQKTFAAWVNNPRLFKTIAWDTFLKNRQRKQIERWKQNEIKQGDNAFPFIRECQNKSLYGGQNE